MCFGKKVLCEKSVTPLNKVRGISLHKQKNCHYRAGPLNHYDVLLPNLELTMTDLGVSNVQEVPLFQCIKKIIGK